MAAFGGEVIVYGDDFDAARIEAMRVAGEDNLAPVPPFHRELVRGVASYALEFFILCGGNIDADRFATGLNGGVPRV